MEQKIRLLLLISLISVLALSAPVAGQDISDELLEQTPEHEFPSGLVVVTDSWDGNQYEATIINPTTTSESILITDAGIRFESDDPLERQQLTIGAGEAEHVSFTTYRDARLTIDDGNINQLDSLYRTWGDTLDTRLGEEVSNPIPMSIGIVAVSFLTILMYKKRDSDNDEEVLNAIR